jgi:hypothetical protein
MSSRSYNCGSVSLGVAITLSADAHRRVNSASVAGNGEVNPAV